MSSKNILKYIIISLLILITLISAASALQEDFWAFSQQKDLNVCSCEVKENLIVVQNTGDIISSYSVSLAGEAQNWAITAPNFFIAEQGEKKSFNNFINIPCDARGEYELITKIQTTLGLEKELNQVLNVQNCKNIEILQKYEQKLEEGVCPCTPAEYSFEIYNTGKHTETYKLSFDQYSEYITLSTDLLILTPGEKQEVNAFVNLPCEIYGNQSIILTVLAKESGMQGISEINLDINKCYDYTILSQENYAVCQNAANQIDLNILNNAEFTNGYYLDIVGPEWVALTNETVALLPEETGSFNLLAIPTKEHNETYEVLVKSISSKGDELRNHTFLLTPENCYDYDLIFDSVQEDVSLYVVNGESEDNTVLIENKGTRDLEYNLIYEAPEWINLTKGTDGVLESGEFNEFNLESVTPETAKGDYLTKLTVTIHNLDNETRTNEILVGVKNSEDAYKIEFEQLNDDIAVDYNLTTHELIIRNNGIKKTKYVMGLDSSPWIKLDTYNLELAPGEGQIINLLIEPTEDVPEMLYKATLYVGVLGTEQEYNQEFFVQVGEKSLLNSEWLWLLLLLLLVLVIGLAGLLFKFSKKNKSDDYSELDETEFETEQKTTKRKTKKELDSVRYTGSYETAQQSKQSKWLKILLLILGIIFIIGIIAVGTYYGLQEVNNDSLNETITPESDINNSAIITQNTSSEKLVQTDLSELDTTNGKLIATNQTKINVPITIKNPTDKTAIFKIQSNNGWIQFDNSLVQINPNTTKTIDVTIIPDYEILKTQNFKVEIEGTITGEKIDYLENFSFEVTRAKKCYENIWFWLIAGIVALGVILLILHPIRKSLKKSREEQVKYKQTGNQLGIWKILIGISLVLIIILIVIGGVWKLGQINTANNQTQTNSTDFDTTSFEENIVTEQTSTEKLLKLDLNGYGSSGTINVENETDVEIKLIITNPTDKKAIFAIETQDNSWATPTESKIIVNENQTETLLINVDLDLEELKESNHKLIINGKIIGEKINYQDNLEVIITKKSKSFWNSYLFFLILALVFLVAIILVVELIIRNKKKKQIVENKQDEMVEEILKVSQIMDTVVKKKTTKKLTKKTPTKEKRTTIALNKK
ncbi:hypothetical protein HN587_06290 [Candidatus Woesearchaeota archaeon]|jgi:hypothetical protein|nr:hypothetical protein [Candidatus Woesearchaeota archaeon]